MNIGQIFLSASVYQMIRGGLIFITAISSIIFLGARLHRHHWTALFFIVSGIGLVGLSSILNNGADGDNIILGIVMVIISQFFSAAHYIIEEKYLMKYYIHPLRVVGLEGNWNLLFAIIMLVVVWFIPCSASYCSNGRLDDALYAVKQMGQHPLIIVYFAILAVSITSYQLSGVFITKLGSAAQRCTIDIARTILIWAFFLIYRGAGHETFQYLELIGFFGIIIGTVVYNEIYVPNIFGFSKNTKVNINIRKSLDGSEEVRLIDDKDQVDGML
jgi:drug/metabolite transporter (DMT)-like permease